MFTATVCHDCEPDFNSHRLCRSEAVALPFAQIFSRHLLRGLLHRSSTTLENLCANRRLADCSKISPPNCSTTNPGLIFPDGEEVAWVGAARHSRTPPTSAVVTPRPFDCGCAALISYTDNSIIFAKIFRLRVRSVCQYPLLWQRAVRSPQRSFRSVTLGNLPGTRYGDRLNVWTTELLARWT